MANTGLILVTIGLWLTFVVCLVATVTPNWVHLSYNDGSNDIKFHSGFFTACLTSGSFGASICVSSVSYSNVQLYIMAVLMIIATILYLTSAIIASTKHRTQATKLDYQNICGTLIAAVALNIAVIGWYGGSAGSQFGSVLALSSSFDVGFEYSFYLAIVSAVIGLILSIMACVFRSDAPDLQTPGAIVMTSPSQPTVVIQQGATGYPLQVGHAPQTGYAPQMGYAPQAGYAPQQNTAYPQKM